MESSILAQDERWRHVEHIVSHGKLCFQWRTGEERKEESARGRLYPGNCSSAVDGISDPVIIGAMIMDIHATPSIPAQPRTTTPGMVHYISGGVARNIAECMTKLGNKPFMISMIGDDMAGNFLFGYWKSAGLAIEGIQRRQDVGTPVVCNVFDANGELAAAVASVEAIVRFN
ncbi:hypothetical protein C5167_010890 [Papaver somniferum]|uniref:Carbohydrate kinase PfkB domain-containing protein n=1 Tax=Papaver somniferum TaxID=3469 RepID=A0A4Y7K5F7_PAPSO|nr:hypothetical protein C5167_010890 [Papaver somniferum]